MEFTNILRHCIYITLMFDNISKQSIILLISAVATVAALQWKEVVIHIINLIYPSSSGGDMTLTIKILLAIAITSLSVWLSNTYGNV